jgi:23S rRNA pseudouridine2605 synthase
LLFIKIIRGHLRFISDLKFKITKFGLDNMKKNVSGKEKIANYVRLNKYIAESGYCSRRKADELISQGVVKVNGGIVIDLGIRIPPDANVTISGDPISYIVKHKYILLNKPKDYITSTKDELGRKTVMDLVKSSSRLFPVGRLDRNTTGVILLTNDGDLANRLTHPKYEVERVYVAGLDRQITLADAQKISEGVELEDGMTAPCEVFVNPRDKTEVTLSLREGKNREVRRIFEALGYDVKKLHRKFYATLSAVGMKRGEFRHLSKKEVEDLRRSVGLK